MNKCGNYPDVMEWLRFMLAFAFVVGFVLLFVSNWDSSIQSADNSTIDPIAKAASAELNSSLPVGLDYLALFVFVAFVVFSVVAARVIPSSPLFVFVAFFAMFLLVLGSMFVGNIWNGFFEQSSVSAVFANMTFFPFMMNFLPFFTLFYVLVVAVALLSKQQFTGGGGL